MYIDTHLDTMWQSRESGRKFDKPSAEGHIDLHRARDAGLFIGFFTGYPTSSAYVTEKMMREWIQYYKHSESPIFQVTNMREYEVHKNHFQNTSKEARNIGALLHFEGAAGIDTELNKLYIYYELGLRSMSLTWNEINQFATGVGDGSHLERGLTREGKDLLDAMESLGIMIDVSHLNDPSFWDVSDHSNKPIFASHSNVRSMCGHKRNLTEEMVQVIADSGGTVGVNFCKGFLHDESDQATLQTVVAMIDKIVDLVGIDHVHIGSDFDGCSLPDDMKDITSVSKLFDKLSSELELDQSELEKIKFGNMERIMRSYLS